MKRSPMKPGKGFKRKLLERKREERKKPKYRFPTGVQLEVLHRGVYVRIPDTVVSCPKENPLEHEGYRRLVAARPCKACGIQGYSQAAHVPPSGKSIKQDDRLTFPLCCTRMLVDGCHVEFDRYRMFPHAVAVEVGTGWAADTARAIHAEGKWPKDLPLPDYLQSI